MTSDNKKQRFEKTVDHLQQRYGLKAIRSLKQHSSQPLPHIPTGFPDLDKTVGSGGIPHGRITELIGIPTSGMTTLALKIITNAQKQGGTVVYLDTTHTFDPDYAHRCDVDLRQLLLVHPYNPQQAAAMLADFALNGSCNLLLFDMPLALHRQQPEQLSATLGRLLAPLNKSGCALLFLTSLCSETSPSLSAYPDHAALPYYASLRLFIERERWLHQRQDVRGYQARIHVLKNKLGQAGQTVPITITFNDIVKGDSA